MKITFTIARGQVTDMWVWWKTTHNIKIKNKK
jgi:hypothetical protein